MYICVCMNVCTLYTCTYIQVFVSWKNQKDDQVPVNSDLITDLRNTSRLLHYCSSPLILLSDHNTPTVQVRI